MIALQNDNPSGRFLAYRVFGTKKTTLIQRLWISKSNQRFATIVESSENGCWSLCHARSAGNSGGFMSGQVVLYFEDQADALRFALAAGSVMAGDGAKVTNQLLEEMARASRIRLDAVSAGNGKKSTTGRAA